MAGNEKHVQMVISKEQEVECFRPSGGKGARITVVEGFPCCSCVVLAKMLLVSASGGLGRGTRLRVYGWFNL